MKQAEHEKNLVLTRHFFKVWQKQVLGTLMLKECTKVLRTMQRENLDYPINSSLLDEEKERKNRLKVALEFFRFYRDTKDIEQTKKMISLYLNRQPQRFKS